MRLTKQILAHLIREELDTLSEELILEQEEEPEEEPAEEEAAEEEGDEEEAAAVGAEEEAEEEGAEEAEVTPAEEVELGKSIDDALTAVLIDYEAAAIKSAQVEKDSTEAIEADSTITVEWHRQPLMKLLFEQDIEEGFRIDLEKFTADVARLVMNYQSLLEGLIINKAKDFLRAQYDEVHAEEFEELLDIRFGLGLEQAEEPPEAPIAAGAGDVGGGA